MARRPTPSRPTAFLLVGLFALLLGVPRADATHFFGGATSWERDFANSPPGSVRILFRLDADWRWSFPFSSGANPPLGGLLLGLHAVSYSGGGGWSGSANLSGTVTAVLPGEDRMTTRSVLALDVPPTAFPITLDIAGCCRISSLSEGNHDQSYRIATVVDVTQGSRSPRYTGLLRLHVPVAAPMSVDLPTAAFDGLSNTTQIAPPSSSLLPFARPVGIAACAAAGCDCYGTNAGQCADALSVSPPSHVAWTPQVAGRYAVQFAVTSRDASGVPKSSVPVDMIIDVQPACPGCPVVTAPATVSAPVGTPLSVPVGVTLPTPDPSRQLYLSTTELPAGATLTPDMALGSLSATLQWTPGAGDLGQRTVCFHAFDQFGALSRGDVCTVITVTSPACVAGSYSATGTAPCTPCPAGRFADGPGRTACTPCGTCSATEYQTSACTAVADAVCGTCDASCVACDGPTAADCTSCPDAEPPVDGVCLPDLCAEGFFGVDGREPCTPCPPGFFADAPGQSACSPCAPGTFAAAVGQMLCNTCAPGSFAAASASTGCAFCATCAGGQFEASACAPSADTACGTCDPSCAACAGPTPADCTSCPSGTPPVAGVCGAGCSPAPAEGCRQPTLAGKSKLDVKDNADDTKDSLKWKWQKGEATSVADFGDPVTTDGWFLCLYDAGVPISSTELPAGGMCGTKPCWAAKPTGFTYKDNELTPDGAQTAVMKAGVAGKPSIALGAKGAALETPDPSAFTGPLRVQLQRAGGGVCFEATYSAPFKKNAGGTFSDVDD